MLREMNAYWGPWTPHLQTNWEGNFRSNQGRPEHVEHLRENPEKVGHWELGGDDDVVRRYTLRHLFIAKSD